MGLVLIGCCRAAKKNRDARRVGRGEGEWGWVAVVKVGVERAALFSGCRPQTLEVDGRAPTPKTC